MTFNVGERERTAGEWVAGSAGGYYGRASIFEVSCFIYLRNTSETPQQHAKQQKQIVVVVERPEVNYNFTTLSGSLNVHLGWVMKTLPRTANLLRASR
jgi:hypothetical protein